MMNNNTSPSNTITLQTPQIIRANYTRTLSDHKPDEVTPSVPISRVILSGLSSAAPTPIATVPQIVSILSPTITNIMTTSSQHGNGINGPNQNVKKCTFHQRQFLHPPSQTHQMVHQIAPQPVQLPSQQQQNPPQHQLIHHQLMQQQIRINNPSIPLNGNAAVNRNTTQANRDAISTNTAPQMNASLLQDRYLLMDMVDGSTFYKCIDIQTQKMMVCKVSREEKFPLLLPV